jgi:hypothetical protein
MIPAPIGAILIALSLVATAPAVRTAETVGPVTPTTAALVATGACAQWEQAALEAGWELDQWPTLDRIMLRESRCQPGATHHNANGTIDRGLMQINSIHLGWLADDGISAADLFDGAINLRAARLLFDRDGWAPWR